MARAFIGGAIFFAAVNILIDLVFLGSQTVPTYTLRGVAWDTATYIVWLVFGVFALMFDSRIPKNN